MSKLLTVIHTFLSNSSHITHKSVMFIIKYVVATAQHFHHFNCSTCSKRSSWVIKSIIEEFVLHPSLALHSCHFTGLTAFHLTSVGSWTSIGVYVGQWPIVSTWTFRSDTLCLDVCTTHNIHTLLCEFRRPMLCIIICTHTHTHTHTM